jgi:hypothetical protein
MIVTVQLMKWNADDYKQKELMGTSYRAILGTCSYTDWENWKILKKADSRKNLNWIPAKHDAKAVALV